jgi:hypothetical protein
MNDQGLTWVQIAGIVAPILATAGGAFWKVCNWVAPRIDKLVNSHVAFLEVTGAAIAAQTPKVEAIRTAIAAQTPKVDEIHGMVCDLHASDPCLANNRRKPKPKS